MTYCVDATKWNGNRICLQEGINEEEMSNIRHYLDSMIIANEHTTPLNGNWKS